MKVPKELSDRIRENIDNMEGFTLRQSEVARLASLGFSNREVGELLDMNENTVKAHLHLVMKKLAVKNRAEMVLRLMMEKKEI